MSKIKELAQWCGIKFEEPFSFNSISDVYMFDKFGNLTKWNVDDEDIEKKAIEHFSQFKNGISLHEALAAFFIKHGAICSTSTVKKLIKRLEKENRIDRKSVV